jgi:hypothetical protein
MRLIHKQLAGKFWEDGDSVMAQVAVRCNGLKETHSFSKKDEDVTCQLCLLDAKPKVVELKTYRDGKPYLVDAK